MSLQSSESQPQSEGTKLWEKLDSMGIQSYFLLRKAIINSEIPPEKRANLLAGARSDVKEIIEKDPELRTLAKKLLTPPFNTLQWTEEDSDL